MSPRFDRPYAFKPARRVFAGRGRSMMTFGEWKIAFYAMVFGGVVGAGWMYQTQFEGASPFALLQPETVAMAQEPAPAAAPVAAAPVVEASLAAPAEEFAPAHLIARAAGVYDGGSIRLDGVEPKIRLWGAEATAREGLDPIEARRALAALVSGKVLSCERDEAAGASELSAHCVTEEGEPLSAAMLVAAAPDYAPPYEGDGD